MANAKLIALRLRERRAYTEFCASASRPLPAQIRADLRHISALRALDDYVARMGGR